MEKQPGYKTKQQETIFEFLKNNAKRHITAGEIIVYLNEQGTKIGASTVYRCLEKLESQGKLRKYVVDDKTGACYQYIEDIEGCSEHFHLKCTKCGKLIHMNCDHMNTIDSHIFEHHGFKVDNGRTVLYGECEECINKENKK